MKHITKRHRYLSYDLYSVFHKNGFSIIEVLVSLAIFSLILSLLVSFVLLMNYSNSRVKANREVQENARRILDIMTYEIKGAKNVYVPTTNSTQISLETSRYLPADEITTFIDFFQCAKNLCLKKESQDAVVLNSDSIEITSLSFIPVFNGADAIPSIQISLTMNYKNPNNQGSSAAFSFNSTVSLRNN